MGNCCCIHDDAVYKPTACPIETDDVHDEVVEKRDPVYPPPDFVCSVCLDEDDQTEIEATLCGHVFHRRCLHDWWNHRYTCPFCGLHMKTLTARQLGPLT